eukprot:Gregarina_sp_Pseudo_9__2935@NODE_314_length_3190_cov_19_874326_g295_i0_p1_GENE_NODE_314_length_3190_cov_19_874326_g295_i0NODE_314_length_3190_cov_19_874326_g295_i0_p1_ORF_typecomplete_len990_score227_99PC_rep/PF01851_22/1_4e04PC_rep/PF01851_22/1_5e04PC_rep/PF01851_22/0_00021PC_rep/PF01851_22/0_0005PC_rep/PF01851_22/6e08PC_rep/PF01851_22/5_5e06PC_rep/PF01851_22/0_0013PC_rep/PF01851_22/7_2e02HEAT_2/PF13646_6/1_4e02HEAT_2/PF13646_6/4_1e05HEAT_2/PF13646_6/9_2e10HEAT_2/PF13646_6/2_1e05HEAT_2/PF13646_
MAQVSIQTIPVKTLLGFLDEGGASDLKRFSLKHLNVLTPHSWFEIADSLQQLEHYYFEVEKDEECRELSALLLSQIYYNLEEYPAALKYGLNAKQEFLRLFDSFYGPQASFSMDLEGSKFALKRFLDMIVALTVDEYIRYRSKQMESALSSVVLGHGSPVDRPMTADMSDSADDEDPYSIQVDQNTVDLFVSHILNIDPHKNPLLTNDPSLKLLLGIALEACNIQMVEQVLRVNLQSSSFALLSHIVRNHELLIPTKAFRTEVFRLIAFLYGEIVNPLLEWAEPTHSQTSLPEVPPKALDELSNFFEVLFYLDDPNAIARCLRAMVNVSICAHLAEDQRRPFYEKAVQLTCDLITFGSQSFMLRLRQHPLLQVPATATPGAEETTAPPSLTVPPAASPASPVTALETPVEVTPASIPSPTDATLPVQETQGTDVPSAPAPSEVKRTDQPVTPEVERLSNINKILTGDYHTSVLLKVAHKKNNTDLSILDRLKAGLDSKFAVLHTSLIAAHGLMQRGTTCDVFLRKNLEWFARSLCWGKFTATASLGVVHQTHVEKSFRVLSTYLPGYSNNASGSNSAFSDGGSLYGLGLIHANRSDTHVINYLLEQLSSGSGLAGRQMANQESSSSTVNEITQHGASLGLGLAAMGSANTNLYESLRSVLMMDSAISGEAAALGIGLVMTGSGDRDVVEDLLQYAKETRHEKIIRACGLAVALTLFRCEEEAAQTIQKMLGDADPLLRYGGCFALGLAYCGTARETALRTLLHVAVSDSSDDVRRAAVLSISYVFCNVPDQTPRVLRLLADSFNSHVRFAATLAIGISCAGTGSPEALAALVPATKDSADVVRQAAFISLGFVLMRCHDPASKRSATETAKDTKKEGAKPEGKKPEARIELSTIPTASEVREYFVSVAIDKKEDIMARVGAIIGLGLLDAGGRNVTTSFFSHRGLLRREAVVGFLLFSQYWYWYPLLLTVSLTMTPVFKGVLKFESMLS